MEQKWTAAVGGGIAKKLIVLDSGNYLIQNVNNTLLWVGKSEILPLGTSFKFESVLFLEGSTVALIGQTQIQVYDCDRQIIKSIITNHENFCSVVYLKEKNCLLVGTVQNEFKIYDIKKKKCLFEWESDKQLDGGKTQFQDTFLIEYQGGGVKEEE